LVVVISGILMNEVFRHFLPDFLIGSEHLVSLPIPGSIEEFLGQFSFPSFESILRPDVWIVGVTIAIVASIETLLCIEASDRLDPLKRFTNTNTELIAQGAGNILSGLIGGIPMTSVIVRTSANINSGAKTKISTIAHGILLLLSVLIIPGLLNKIPLASLAAVLIMIGLKLASPKVFKHMWDSGKYQFIPFLITVLAVVFTDLLKGVGIGLIVSIFFILRANLKLAYFFKREKYHEGDVITMKLAQEVSFLNKAAIKQTLNHLPENSKLLIDASDTFYIDHDVLQLIREFRDIGSKEKDIQVNLKGFKEEYQMDHSIEHVTSN
jgi:MFS superfamily sulfate permease-like transporter